MPPLNAGPLLVQRDPEGALGGLRRLVRDLRLVCTRILTAPGSGAGMNVRKIWDLGSGPNFVKRPALPLLAVASAP